MKFRFLIIIAFLLTSCKNESKVGHHFEKDFFDLRSFIDDEIIKFTKKGCTVYKEAQINEEEDDAVQIDLSEYDFNKDLKVLKDFHINKTAWYDYFNIDTIIEQIDGIGEVQSILYTTQSQDIPIKSLKVSFPNTSFDRPILIEGERKIKNWMFHTEQKFYYTGSAFRLEGYQKVLWFEAKNFNITTIYNCNNESN